MIQRVPIPLAVVMLGVAALGNLLQSFSAVVRLGCGVVAALLAILLLIKVIAYPGLIRAEMSNPIMASIAATFSMGLMLLSVYAKPYIGGAAIYIWYFTILLPVAIIAYFTFRFIFLFYLKIVFASSFFPYDVLSVFSITAPAYVNQ